MHRQPDTYWISDLRQLRALASPLRQEIVDVVESAGPCSITHIAAALALPPDRLYFHIRRLLTVGLLVKNGERRSGRHVAALYALPRRRVRVRFDRRDARVRKAVGAIHDGVLRLARRDLRRGMSTPEAIVHGDERDTWAGRYRGWLPPAQVKRMNRLIEELGELIRSSSPRRGARPIALSLTIAPPRTFAGNAKGVES